MDISRIASRIAQTDPMEKAEVEIPASVLAQIEAYRAQHHPGADLSEFLWTLIAAGWDQTKGTPA